MLVSDHGRSRIVLYDNMKDLWIILTFLVGAYVIINTN